jgi:hypothetical protein
MKKEEAIPEDKKGDISDMIIHSKLLSGGIEQRLVTQVFSKESLETIQSLHNVIGDKKKSHFNGGVSEDDKLLQAIIKEG